MYVQVIPAKEVRWSLRCPPTCLPPLHPPLLPSTPPEPPLKPAPRKSTSSLVKWPTTRGKDKFEKWYDCATPWDKLIPVSMLMCHAWQLIWYRYLCQCATPEGKWYRYFKRDHPLENETCINVLLEPPWIKCLLVNVRWKLICVSRNYDKLFDYPRTVNCL